MTQSATMWQNLIETAAAKDVRMKKVNDNFSQISLKLALEQLSPDQLAKFFDRFFYIIAMRLKQKSEFLQLNKFKRTGAYFEEVFCLQQALLSRPALL